MKSISRRESLAVGIGLGTGMALMAGEAQAQGAAMPTKIIGAQAGPVANPYLSAPVTLGSVKLERESEHTALVPKLNGGTGQVTVRRFGFDNAQAPAGFITYVIAPGNSEGVHIHGIDLPHGPFDEYYYVLAGAGEMSMDGKVMPVKTGDHVHAPMGVAHGIENTMAEGDLKVLITYIRRA